MEYGATDAKCDVSTLLARNIRALILVLVITRYPVTIRDDIRKPTPMRL